MAHQPQLQLIGGDCRIDGIRRDMGERRFIGGGGVLESSQVAQAVARFGVSDRSHTGGAGVASLSQHLKLLPGLAQLAGGRLGGVGHFQQLAQLKMGAGLIISGARVHPGSGFLTLAQELPGGLQSLFKVTGIAKPLNPQPFGFEACSAPA